jgi:cell wall-associated NlpC family hydrolase
MLRKLAIIAVGLTALVAIPTPAHATAPAPAAAVVASNETARSLYLGPPDATRVVPQPATIAPAALAAAAARTYQVVSGDMLGVISQRFCGSFGAYPGLAAASGIRNPDLIYPAQTIQLSGCTAQVSTPAKASPPRPAPAPPVASAPSGRAGAAVAFALRQVGKWYSWGTAGPNTYDCSGLAMAAYASIGIRLPHNAAAQTGYGWRVSRSELRAGDLVFPYAGLGHVVIYIGNGQIVEAPHSGARVSVRALYGFYTARRLV